MKENETIEFTSEDIVNNHELSWTVKVPLGKDEAMSSVMESDIITSDTDRTYAAIAIPSDYKIVKWSDDEAHTYGTYHLNEMKSIELGASEGYTIYYINTEAGAFSYGSKTPTYYILIEHK
jgi:hypothetical protein